MAEFTGLHADLTRKIIAAARRVHRTLGTGFLEKVYENSLALELKDAGLIVAQSEPIEVRYRGQVVGIYEADILVNDLVILELKAVEQLVVPHEVQLVNYLRVPALRLGS